MSSAWGRSASQRSGGNSGWVEANVAMRWFLPVLMPRSEKLVRWSLGGGELNGDVAGEEELLDSTRFLVVEDELGEGVADVAEEIGDEGEGCDVGLRGLVLLGGELNVSLVYCNEDVVVSLAGLNGQST